MTECNYWCSFVPEKIVLSLDRDATGAVANVLDTEFYGHDAVVKLRAVRSHSS